MRHYRIHSLTCGPLSALAFLGALIGTQVPAAEGNRLIPFNQDEIKSVTILNALDLGNVRTIATVDPRFHAAIYASLAESQPPKDKSGFPCVWSRETVIRLNDGRAYCLHYHGECAAPEYSLAKQGEHTGRALWSLRLKELLKLLESEKATVRFTLLEKQVDGRFAVVASVPHSVRLGIPCGWPDGEGKCFELSANVSNEGQLALDVKVRDEKAGTTLADEKVLLRQGEFLPHGCSRVLTSSQDLLVLMTVEPARCGSPY